MEQDQVYSKPTLKYIPDCHYFSALNLDISVDISEIDGACTVFIDTAEDKNRFALAKHNADGPTPLRIYLNDEPIYENPPYMPYHIEIDGESLKTATNHIIRYKEFEVAQRIAQKEYNTGKYTNVYVMHGSEIEYKVKGEK